MSAIESKQFPTGRRSLPLRVLGAGRADGRGPSIWDKFSSVPVVVAGGDTGDVAAGHYHRWPYAIRILVDLGVDSYGLSVSWLRVSPREAEGSNDGGPVFTAGWSGLLRMGSTPSSRCATGIPQALEDDGVWRDREIARRFADYAAIVYEALGDVVTRWTTLNEPYWYCALLAEAHPE